MTNASQIQSDSLADQVRSLLGAVDRLQSEVGQLRSENEELRKQVGSLRCDAGYWKSRHADALKRNELLQADLDQAKGEIRLLKAEHFGRSSEKEWNVDRSSGFEDADQPAKKNRIYLSRALASDTKLWRGFANGLRSRHEKDPRFVPDARSDVSHVGIRRSITQRTGEI